MDVLLVSKSIEDFSKISFSRSGGCGGQNVNKVNTKVLLTMPLEKLQGLNYKELSLLKKRLFNMINSSQELYLSVQDTRQQGINKDIAKKRLLLKITNATKRQKHRIKTHPTKASCQKRLKLKKLHANTKALRQKVTI